MRAKLISSKCNYNVPLRIIVNIIYVLLSRRAEDAREDEIAKNNLSFINLNLWHVSALIKAIVDNSGR